MTEQIMRLISTGGRLVDARPYQEYVQLAGHEGEKIAEMFVHNFNAEPIFALTAFNELCLLMFEIIAPYFPGIVVNYEEWQLPEVIKFFNDYERDAPLFFFMLEHDGTSITDVLQMWEDSGCIKPGDGIFGQIKDAATKELVGDKYPYVDYWRNAEGDSFIKFPACNYYHRLSYPWDESYIDPENRFINGGQCDCQYPGNTVSIQRL